MVGGKPNAAEQILIGRCIALEWDLVRFRVAQARGEELTAAQMRHRLALEDTLRLALVALQPAEREAA
jgi:hypothetical protein